MFREFNGRVWESEEKYKEYKDNVRKYMSRSLAVEHYADYSGDNSVYKDPAFLKLKEYRADGQNLDANQIFTTTAELVQLFNNLIEKIGTQKFIKSEDGSVDFNWQAKKDNK